MTDKDFVLFYAIPHAVKTQTPLWVRGTTEVHSWLLEESTEDHDAGTIDGMRAHTYHRERSAHEEPWTIQTRDTTESE